MTITGRLWARDEGRDDQMPPGCEGAAWGERGQIGSVSDIYNTRGLVVGRVSRPSTWAWAISTTSGSTQLLNNGPLLDTTPPVITVSTMPNILWPPNGTMRPVTISGTISDTGSGYDPTSAAYSVGDEYGDVQPKGAITLDAGGRYSVTVLLPASRRGNDSDGRHYIVTVSAKDHAGNNASSASVVTVPHDKRH